MESGGQVEKSASQGPGGTLGDVLYGDQSQPRISEKDWVVLVRTTAAGEQLALYSLYERTHRLVFTLIMRITSNRQVAEHLTLEVYDQIWTRSARYDRAEGTVLGWIMNQARAHAIERLRFEQRIKGHDPKAQAALLTIDMPDFRDVMEVKERRRAIENALTVLGREERRTIELTFFSELTHAQVAQRLDEPLATIKTRTRTALSKLRHALQKKLNATSSSETNPCRYAELVCAHAVRALPADEVPAVEEHLSSCRGCRREFESLGPVLAAFVSWPTDVLRPSASLQNRLAERIAAQTGVGSVYPEGPLWSGMEWNSVSTGISCSLLATDEEEHVVSMLVRLAPGGEYPPHRHAGVEELHLLDGELWIDERKLYPGDYHRAEPGTDDKRVWSETGCTCVLITSTKDVLR